MVARVTPILFAMCLASVAASARTIDLSVNIVSENNTIDSSTPYCGIVELENTGQSSYKIKLPFFSERNFKWEVRYKGKLESVEKLGYILTNISNPALVSLAPGEKLAIPFALMRFQGIGFLFEHPGVYDVRAIVIVRGHNYSSSWETVNVRPTEYSAAWRKVFSSGNWLRALYPTNMNEELIQFVGTHGFDNWLAYVAFDIRTNTAKKDLREWGTVFPEELNQELQRVLAAKKQGSPSLRLWKSIGEDLGRERESDYNGSDCVLRWH